MYESPFTLSLWALFIEGAKDTIFYYFLFINSCYLLLVFYAAYALMVRYREVQAENVHDILTSDSLPVITFIVPSYNEEKNILSTISNIRQISYRHKQIIVVNDGSSDNTLSLLQHHFSLVRISPSYPGTIQTQQVKNFYKSTLVNNLMVIDKANGGKADALNAGINALTGPLFVCIDSDTLIDEHGINQLIRPFLMDSATVAAGASVRIVNGCTIDQGHITHVGFPNRLLCQIQAVEYLRGFFIGRLGWNWTRGSLIVSGAFSLFKTDIVREIGGYEVNTVGEDMEIIVRLHRYMLEKKRPYKIAFIPDPIAWTEAPEKLKLLGKQRTRWHEGLIQSLWKHKRMLFNPRYKVVGLITFPFYVLAELISPLIELMGYVTLASDYFSGRLDWSYAWIFIVICWGFATNLALMSIIFEEMTYRRYGGVKHIFLMLYASLVENVGYRQWLMVCRLKAFKSAWKKGSRWTNLARVGYGKVRK